VSHNISLADVESAFAGLEVAVDAPVWDRVETPCRGGASQLTAADEEVMYRSFAEMLGIEEEPPKRMVTLPTEEYEALVAEAATLPGLLRLSQRPEGWSVEEELGCQAFLHQIGLG